MLNIGYIMFDKDYMVAVRSYFVFNTLHEIRFTSLEDAQSALTLLSNHTNLIEDVNKYYSSPIFPMNNAVIKQQKHFYIKNGDNVYVYSIVEFGTYTLLHVKRGYISKLLDAAIKDDLEAFIHEYTEGENLFNITSCLVEYGSIKIIEYLFENLAEKFLSEPYNLNYKIVRFGTLDCFKLLLDKSVFYPSWIQTIVYHNRYEIAKYLFNTEYIYGIKYECKLDWFKRWWYNTFKVNRTKQYLISIPKAKEYIENGFK